MILNQHKVPFIQFPKATTEVQRVVNDVMENGVYFNGKYTQQFVSDFSDFMELKYCIPTANCTDSLEIIIRASGVGEGDEVIVPAFTWFSDASVVQIVGSGTIFVDIDLEHFGISIKDLTAKITSATKAVILPHLFGITHPQIQLIKNICAKNNMLLIEDCAQAHGSTFNGQLAGSFGDVAAFSFYPTKNLGALGDAGAILTNNSELSEKLRLWANHGQKSRNEHQQLGKNSRMDELQAAILTAKLPYLASENKKRRELAQIYLKALSDLPLSLPKDFPGHVYHQFVILVDQRDELKAFLHQNNIETDIHYPNALVSMSVFEKQNSVDFPNSIKAANHVLSLPIHPSHTLKDIQIVCKLIRSFFRK